MCTLDVLCTFSSVDAVPRDRVVCGPHAIYTLEYHSTWVSLLSREPRYVQCIFPLVRFPSQSGLWRFQNPFFLFRPVEFMHESLLINKYKPTINVQGSSILLTFFNFLTVFACTCPRITLSHLVLIIPNCPLYIQILHAVSSSFV